MAMGIVQNFHLDDPQLAPAGITYIPISASPQHGPSRLDPFFARSAAPERHSDSVTGLSIRNKFKHIAKYTKFFCVKFLFQYFTRVARKGHTPDLFKHYCRSIGSARAAVQHISLTDSRFARQASVAATSVAQHRRRNLIRASAAPFSTVEVRTARLRHETIPTDDAHASWPQARFATAAARYIYLWYPPPHVPYTPRHKRDNRAHRHAIS